MTCPAVMNRSGQSAPVRCHVVPFDSSCIKKCKLKCRSNGTQLQCFSLPYKINNINGLDDLTIGSILFVESTNFCLRRVDEAESSW